MITPADAYSGAVVPASVAHVSTATFEGETVLYDSVRCRPFLLNVSAAAVWGMVDGTRTLAEIVTAVAAQFGADPALVEPDVRAAVADFTALELLVDRSK